MIGTIEMSRVAIHTINGAPAVWLLMKIAYINTEIEWMEYAFSEQAFFTPEAYCEAVRHLYSPSELESGLMPQGLEGREVEFELTEQEFSRTFILASVRYTGNSL